MVKTLHSAGLEVILDVVYNHTGEGDEHGPTLSFRGIDNTVYYRLDPADRRRYVNETGTGNTLNAAHPAVLQLIMDSLRYWVSEMHVDGFRFDLAAALARTERGFDRLSPFLGALQQDPVLSRVKLIAEPWDLGPGGYQVGGFPPGWAEWNDKYRDTVRSYWRGDDGRIGELASRLAGSSDLFQHSGRSPSASINFVTAHDGFTLHDLVSYERKHNEANHEHNRDGSDNDRSWNCGVEGPSDQPHVRASRERQQRNLLCTLLLSQGVPMLVAGDEMGRTQQGNNNAYCQDNELSWIDWKLASENRLLFDFVRALIRLRAAHPLFRRRTWFLGRAAHGAALKDISWLKPGGEEMSDAEWNQSHARSLGVMISGSGHTELDERGRPIEDDDLLVLLNANDHAESFALATGGQAPWTVLIDTSCEAGSPEPGAAYEVKARSVALLARSRR
jgi:glycogen operon protein